MNHNFDCSFLTMTAVAVEADKLRCRFENGDEAVLDTGQLVPPGYQDPQWVEARLDPDGWTITVPATPSPYKIPSDVVRSRTHEGFAGHLAARDRAFRVEYARQDGGAAAPLRGHPTLGCVVDDANFAKGVQEEVE